MKGIDIFCASHASTAICLSMEDPSSSPASPSSTILLGDGSCSPAIDRCNPIITDSRRAAKQPILPVPKLHKKSHKKKNQKVPPKENGDQAKNVDKEKEKEIINRQNWSSGGVRKSWSCTKPGDFISPPGSTRYLLSEKVFINALSDLDPALNLFPGESSKSKAVKTNEAVDAKPPSPSGSPDQVVVLRVSLHCRGCERKMRKHISRMEGVSSFNIDFAAKKVTVTGTVTPLEVLSSISKVKNAQLWSPTLSSSSSSTPTPINLSHSELRNQEIRGAGAWAMDEGNFVRIAS